MTAKRAAAVRPTGTVIGAGARAHEPAGSAMPLLFRGVRIFDGERVREDADSVLVSEGRIVDVGRGLASPAGARLIHGDGRTLLPGLIDGHLHIVSRDVLRNVLAFGITTVIDLFMDIDLLSSLRSGDPDADEHGQGGALADFRSAGALVTAPRGHGTEYGLPVGEIRGPAEADSLIDELIVAGSDFIKVVYDDGSQYGLSFPTLDQPTLRAVVAAAHRRGRAVVAHIGTLEGACEAVNAGVDGLAHVFLDRMPGPDFGVLVARHGAFVSPTLASLLGVTGTPAGVQLADDPRLVPWLAQRSRMNLRHAFPAPPSAFVSYEAAEEAVRRLHAAGVRLVAGSDAPSPGTAFGASLHGELELFVRAGIPAREALRAATAAPADAFGLHDRGRVDVGQIADLVLVDGDPTADITITRAIAGVWKRGVAIDRDALRQDGHGAREAAGPGGGEARIATSASAARVRPLLLCDFDGSGRTASFGSGLAVSTDRIIGGASVAEVAIRAGGARGTPGCLEVSGEIRSGAPFPWSGVAVYPGRTPLEPADLSRFTAIRFWARGEGRRYRIILFCRTLGLVPLIRYFEATDDWNAFRFPIQDFNRIDGHDVTAIVFCGGPEPGPFRFWIDELELE